MVLFVSGRTDILSCYPRWFINRVREGYVDVRNPFVSKSISRIFFSDVDIILFCTKNPHPFLPHLDELDERMKDVPLIFHVTLTPYHEDIEPVIGRIKRQVIEDIRTLSRRYGPDRIFIRYDPILLNSRYDLSYHIRAFDKLTSELEGYSRHIVISFIDIYKNVRHNASILRLQDIADDDIDRIGSAFSELAHERGFEIFTCGERRDLTEYGFVSGACLSKAYASALFEDSDKRVTFKRQTNRRGVSCDCVQMADIGDYNTCSSRCRYCYANYDESRIQENIAEHDDDSSLLVGHINETDIIRRRK